MRIFTVDAFTSRAFTGNPAGVCILEKPISEELYQLIAREINLSETAFVEKIENQLSIRWFTPKVEVNLCGHATLSAAHILYQLGYCKPNDVIIFDSKSGKLTAQKVGDKIELNFPQIYVDDAPDNEIIKQAFGIKPIYIGKNENRYLIEIESVQKLINIIPDFHLLKSTDLGRFIITAKSDCVEYDFVSRYFAPAVGVLEDPVTGTAHCYLAPYWGRKLNKKLLIGFQASQRAGSIECELIENNRLFLRSHAVTMTEIVPKWLDV